MASESGRARSYVGRLVTDRNGHMNLFIPFFFGVPDVSERTEAASRGAAADSESDGGPDEIRVVLVNPLHRSYIVLEGVSEFEALFGGLSQSKPGQPPASKASIEAMPDVEIGDDERDLDCSICLDEMKAAKEMPCKHRFHSGCVEKWLRIHGSCPVCRYQLPAEEQSQKKGGDEDGNNGGVQPSRAGMEMWIPFSITRIAVDNSNDSSNQETEQQQTEHNHNSD
uniref:RING-type E3 ubiquitin transferase n=1 Tax=Kalanchoe fedtschenkoi TaxID=63787 RepID=A0A7N1A7E6_KALFE